MSLFFFFFFQAEDGIRDVAVTGVQTCALPIWCTPKSVCLGTGFGAKFAQQPMGEGLFQSGQHQRRISALRLGEEKMDMLRHDHVTDDYKLVALADMLHNFEEEIARAGCPEKGTAWITTCGNKCEYPAP